VPPPALALRGGRLLDEKRETTAEPLASSHHATEGPDLTLRARYLDLMEAVLTGTIIEDPPIPTPGYTAIVGDVLEKMFGRRFAPDRRWFGYNAKMRERGLDWPQRAFTMVGRKRLHNFRTLIEAVIADRVPGDIVETGVWRGGASILARAVLQAHEVTDRRVVLADSFCGLPPPDTAQFPADAESDLHLQPDLAVGLEQVQKNFRRFDLLDDQVVFVPGWFRDTMPTLDVTAIAVLRLDGDMFESTIDPMRYLYDRVSPGGYVIVDDYHIVAACRRAVEDFCASRRISPAFIDIDGMGVYFRKSAVVGGR
jgi:hypothetical protein